MHHWHSNATGRGKAISWLLILAFAVLVFYPVHIHMLHDDVASADGGHVTKVHAHADFDDSTSGEPGHTLDPLSDNTLKSSGFHVSLFALFLSVLLLMLPPKARLQSPRDSIRPPSLLRRHRTPPLRAPPRA